MKALIICPTLLFAITKTHAAGYGNPVDASGAGGEISLLAIAAIVALFWWLGKR